MTSHKSADQNLTEELIHKEGRGKWGKFEESKNVVDDDGGCNGPTIKHTSYFEEVGELYIAGWGLFEDAIIHWTNKEFQRIAKDLQTEQKNQK